MISPKEIRENLPNPREIIACLDEYIIGQEQAKKTLSLMLLNRGLSHLARKGLIEVETPIQKSNVLLIGPTGTGKTALIKALSEIVGMPISIFDVTSITSAGYIGNKVEDALLKHMEGVDDFIEDYYRDMNEFTGSDYASFFAEKKQLLMETAEAGIIYLDEIDKIRMRESNGIDINGDMVQNELLKILDNGDISLDNARGSKGSKFASTVVRTDDLFFICGGAFSGLEDIISKRLNLNAGIGFSSALKRKASDEKGDNLLKYVSTQDLIDYGFKPEFLGRVPLRATLEPLDVSALITIMTTPKNSVFKQYQETFKVFGVDLVIEQDALEEMANLAIKLKTGARSIKTIFANVLSEALLDIFDSTDEKFIVTKELVRSRGAGNEI